MKKNLFFVIFIALSAVFSLTSCTDEKKEMIESLNYKKACELKDFQTAYEIVDKLKEVTSKKKVRARGDANAADEGYSYAVESVSEYEEAKKVSDEAEKYVVLQEAITVLEESGTNGLMRIVGIAKEHNAERWLYSELLDVANKIGDTDLAERFQNIIKSGNQIEKEEDY